MYLLFNMYIYIQDSIYVRLYIYIYKPLKPVYRILAYIYSF